MRFSFAAFFIALVAPLMVIAAPSTSDIPQLAVTNVELDLPVTHSNLTERTYYYTTSTWTDLRCDQIAGTFRAGWFSVYFNFGCICYGDIDTFCYRNGHSYLVNQWIRQQFALLQTKTFRYPTGAQPTCNDKGGYVCPYGTKSDGTCSDKAVQCGDGYCLQADGYCCPRGTKSFGGTCCALTCSGASNGKCYGSATCSGGKVLSNEMCCEPNWTGYKTVCCPAGQMEDPANPGKCMCSDSSKILSNGVCTSRCPTGQTWMGNTKCCPSYQTLVNGQCACADPTMVDDPVNKCCKARCTTQQNWDAAQNKCVPKCATGFTWSASSLNPTGLCCSAGTTCRNKVCCKPEEEEMGPGKCCLKGSTWNYTSGKCQAPSGVPTAPVKARRSKLPARKLNLEDKTRLRMDEKLCPKDFSACPIDNSGSGSYECLDSFTDITSCGGCASVGEGQDCTAIKGAKWMGCDAGTCVVYSCRKGFKLVDGKTCVKA